MADEFTYGVLPTGFSRKPLDRILFELQASARSIFGPDIIVDHESPMGQIIGLAALLVAQNWEIAEEVYQSYDPDQAEGVRLDILARIRVLDRGDGEADQFFRAAITNKDRARNDIQDLVRAVRGLAGVTYAHVFTNEGREVDPNHMLPGEVALAVLGGDDAAIAAEARRYIVPGISTFGNVQVNTVINGFCRAINIIRPILIPVKLIVSVRTRKDVMGCPPPSPTAIKAELVNSLSVGERSLVNGDDVTLWRIRRIIENRFSNVEVASFVGERDDIAEAPNWPVFMGFFELATFTLNDTIVEVVE